MDTDTGEMGAFLGWAWLGWGSIGGKGDICKTLDNRFLKIKIKYTEYVVGYMQILQQGTWASLHFSVCEDSKTNPPQILRDKCMSIFMPVPHCIDYCNFVVSFEIRKREFSNSVFLFQDCFNCLKTLVMPYEFESVVHFGDYCYLKNNTVSLPIH